MFVQSVSRCISSQTLPTAFEKCRHFRESCQSELFDFPNEEFSSSAAANRTIFTIFSSSVKFVRVVFACGGFRSTVDFRIKSVDTALYRM